MKHIIIANWKMNPATLPEAKELFDSVAEGIKNAKDVEVVICPPFLYIPAIRNTKYDIQIGGQDCFWENPPAGGGAFTGEVSAAMLKDLDCEYVILGHSERRKFLNETDEMINKKITAALKQNLKPTLCISNLTQLKKSLRGIKNKIVIAYEPVFAIGTGNPCPVEKAKKMRNSIKYPVVLYGGSVNSKNANDYVKAAGFQGLLIGSASLNSQEFFKIVQSID